MTVGGAPPGGARSAKDQAASLTSGERATLVNYALDNYKPRLVLMRRLAVEGMDVGRVQDYLDGRLEAQKAAKRKTTSEGDLR